MIDLRKDFENRIENGNQKLFQQYRGSLFCKEIKFYFFYILRKIQKSTEYSLVMILLLNHIYYRFFFSVDITCIFLIALHTKS